MSRAPPEHALNMLFVFAFVPVILPLKLGSWTCLALKNFRGMDLSRWDKPLPPFPPPKMHCFGTLPSGWEIMSLNKFKWINGIPWFIFCINEIVKICRTVVYFMPDMLVGYCNEWAEVCAWLWRDFQLSSDELRIGTMTACVWASNQCGSLCICVCFCVNKSYHVSICLLSYITVGTTAGWVYYSATVN